MTLNIGDSAPGFSAKDQNGISHSLSDFNGRKLALYFYPKDNTPGCTAQACNISENFETLKNAGIDIIGVSVDDEKSHKKFEEKYNLPFILLVDSDKKIVQDYGVWGLKKFMGKEYMGTNRVTFLINEDGKIEHIIEKVKTKEHAAQILDLWAN